MGRKQNGPEATNYTSLIFFLVISCALVYAVLSVVLRPSPVSEIKYLTSFEESGGEVEREDGGCCRGIEHLELWGNAVKWGSEFKFNSSEECCKACKAMCSGSDGPCLCDSWVFCGSRDACGTQFGEVSLNLLPDMFMSLIWNWFIFGCFRMLNRIF